MKFINLALILLFINICGYAQITDTALAKKITINGFCLCQTTLSSLKESYPDLKETDVEEMDLPAGCFSHDARYISGKGYATDKNPGIIFQKDQNSDYISKIRLTRLFKGNLPNGMYVDLNALKLKDLSSLYPELKDKWESRDCSNYWNFSNDTISFYIKIDTGKQPQFPIDKTYYMDKPIEGIDLVLSCYSIPIKQTKQIVTIPDSPTIFIDSVEADNSALQKLKPKDIAFITVIKDSIAVNKVLPGASGLVYMETKKFARHQYWNYFNSKSPEYSKIVSSPESDTTHVAYILNGKVLNVNYEGSLVLIDNVTFRGMAIINKEELVKEYGITNKEYGIVIITNPRAKKSK